MYQNNNQYIQHGQNGFTGSARQPAVQAQHGGKPRPKDYPIVQQADERTQQTWLSEISGNATVLFDTCALMAYRAQNLPALFTQLIYPLAQRARLYIVEETRTELLRLAAYSPDPDSRALADLAYRYEQSLEMNGLIKAIEGVARNPDQIPNGKFADPSITGIALDCCSHGKDICIVTRDHNLAHDLTQISQMSCVAVSRRGLVKILYLDTKLRLKPFQTTHKDAYSNNQQPQPVVYGIGQQPPVFTPVQRPVSPTPVLMQRPAYPAPMMQRPAYLAPMMQRPDSIQRYNIPGPTPVAGRTDY